MKNEIKQLKAEIARLSARLDQRPAKITMGARGLYRIIIIDQGQELESGDLGIKWSEDPITELASDYDPDSVTTYPDGIGRGTLYVNGIEQDGYVLVINDTLSGISSAVIQSDSCFASAPITMDAGAGKAIVYRIF